MDEEDGDEDDGDDNDSIRSAKTRTKILVVRRVGVSLRTAARRQTKSSTRGPCEDREGSSAKERESDRARERGGRLVDLRGPIREGDACGSHGHRGTHMGSHEGKASVAAERGSGERSLCRAGVMDGFSLFEPLASRTLRRVASRGRLLTRNYVEIAVSQYIHTR